MDGESDYLHGTPSLDGDLLAHFWGRRPLTEAEAAAADAVIQEAKTKIRAARERWEQEHGVVIEPEPGTLPRTL